MCVRSASALMAQEDKFRRGPGDFLCARLLPEQPSARRPVNKAWQRRLAGLALECTAPAGGWQSPLPTNTPAGYGSRSPAAQASTSRLNRRSRVSGRFASPIQKARNLR